MVILATSNSEAVCIVSQRLTSCAEFQADMDSENLKEQVLTISRQH